MTTVAEDRATRAAEERPGEDGDREEAGRGFPWRRAGGLVVLALGAFVFLFPFYYMIVGALQEETDTSVGGAFPNPVALTLRNLAQMNDAIDIPRTLLNSGIFTGGVILATLLLGLLAGYALAVLDFRGRGVVFGVVLLNLVLPFHVLMIPLYVLIVRTYGLGNTFLGMILPFAVNASAVFIFRQFFRSIPKDLFESARIDGASEFQILTRMAIPLARPAILTGIIVTFIGPWNEFLWPFLITKQRDMQPLAVALASFIETIQASVANPFGAILAGATVLALPAVVLFLTFQRYFLSTGVGSSVKG